MTNAVPVIISPVSTPDTRSTWSVIWGCLTVVVACTWLSIHPNIPALGDTSLAVFGRRLRLMFTALVAPEFMLLWAFRQWFGARDIAHTIGKGTSTRQGFFLLMGGFVGPSRSPIDPQTCPGDIFELTQINDPEIADRSKSDVLGKGIALLQTIWFVAQCMARVGTSGLAITEIEVVALGLAVMSTFSYVLWLDKPLNVCRPVQLAKAPAIMPSPVDDDAADTLRQMPLLLGPIITLTSLFGDATYCSRIPPHAMRVPTFYSPPITHNQMLLSYMFAAITGSVFGAIHLLAWGLDFPSIYELHLWRVSSVITTSYPLVLFIYLWLISRWSEEVMFGDNPSTSLWRSVFDVCVVFGLFLYVASRLILMALACTTLRRLPMGSERGLGWVMYIPHL